MTDTTIAVSQSVKERIDAMQRDGETYNGTLLRLVEGYEHGFTPAQREEIERIAEQVVRDLR